MSQIGTYDCPITIENKESKIKRSRREHHRLNAEGGNNEVQKDVLQIVAMCCSIVDVVVVVDVNV